MMDVIRNHIRLEAERALSQLARTRIGIVDSYDPSHYACKVKIQPEDSLSGWLPVTTPWVGNGWGLYAPPTPGDIVEVHFQEGDQESPFIVQRFFSNSIKPLAVQSGELWIVHQSGSFLKFHNDGSVEVNAANHLNVTGEIHHTGNYYQTGSFFATGDITDQTGTTNESMKGMREVFNTHHHVDVTHGSDLSGLPDELM